MHLHLFKKIILCCFAVVYTSLFICGCADPVVFSEVFQLHKGEKLYTKYNIWYNDSNKINCLNIQQGTFIPLGTEIDPIETTFWGNKIIFSDTSGKKYSISFDEGYRLCPMYVFIKDTFGTENREQLLAKATPAARKHILRGEVIPGMSKQDVLLAYGPPPGVRTPDLRNESWIYWTSPSKTIRLVWRNDKVRNILNVNAD